MSDNQRKRIAETINIRINVGNYQHIDITKYAEKDIEYSSNEEMKSKEDLLTSELLDNIIRNMRTIPERLGKQTDAVDKVEELISTEIPKWLSEGPVPNIANNVKESHNSVLAEIKDIEDKTELASKEDKELLEKTSSSNEVKVSDDGLFDDLNDGGSVVANDSKEEDDLFA